jgi:hypothetical protein
MSPEVSAATGQVPFSHRILQEISQAFRRDARREDLSEEKAGRFEAWVLAFVSWCAGQDSECPVQESGAYDSGEVEASEVKACRIGAFQVALRGRPECTQQEAIEAMDALAFLFGAAGETKAALRSAGFSVENGGESSTGSSAGQDTSDEDLVPGPSHESTSDKDTAQRETVRGDTAPKSTVNKDAPDEPAGSRSRGVFPGWPGEETGEKSATGETDAAETGTEESTGLDQEAISRPASHEDASSTAKAFVRAFHSQLDSMHDRASENGDEKLQGKMQGPRAH